jgi:RNA polymerase sigma-70 factor (ECF subfamily)
VSSALRGKFTTERSGGPPRKRTPLPPEPRELSRVPEAGGGDLEIGGHSSDADLARALLANRAEAAILVQQRFRPVIRGLLRRALGTSAESEDVEQDVFLNVFSTIHGLREPSALRAFVITITKRTLGHALRRRRARAHLAVDTEPQESQLIGEIGDAAARHAFFHFQHLLERLRERERQAFFLRFVAQREAEEIATALGVSLPTARRLFARASRRMLVWARRSQFLGEYVTASDHTTAGRKPKAPGA